MNHDKHKTIPTANHTPGEWTRNGTQIIAIHCDEDGEHETLICDLFNEHDWWKANARRICAAVNSCKGISTEALERGVVAELRHCLGMILDAAGDLDAALDGVTEEFDDERGRLNAAIRTTQDTLDAGTEIDVAELLASRKQVASIWGIEDVRQVRPDLTAEQAWEVLFEVGRKHDAEYGINWTTLECVAENLFGYAPKTDEAEEA